MLNTKTKKLLHILSDGNLHSGASLGDALGVTRSAVWKFISQLKKTTRLEISAKTNQGYRLSHKIELLDIHQIKAYLSQRYHPYLDKTIIFDEIPSTNTYLLQQPQIQDSQMYVCLAEMQTAGRGRFNRPWISPFGNNICLSLLWRFLNDLTQLSGLSLAIAVSIVRAFKKYGIKERIDIKWPNDLFWQGRKLGGILIELRGEFHHNCDAVIGVGLNLYMDEKQTRASDFPLAHLTEITQNTLKRNKVVGFLLEELLDALAIFQEQGLKPFMKEFESLDYTFNKPVKITHGQDIFYGTGRGIDENGCFLLEGEDGKIKNFICGEASLRLEQPHQ